VSNLSSNRRSMSGGKQHGDSAMGSSHQHHAGLQHTVKHAGELGTTR
jgi:hypothetical protein